MRALSESVAFAAPSGLDGLATAAAVKQAKKGKRSVEVRLGVGPMKGGLGARVIGHASCIRDALNSDVPSVAGPVTGIVIVSSAPKAGSLDLASAAQSLAALGGALRLVGIRLPISMELANPLQEVPDSLRVELPDALTRWFERAAQHADNGADPRRYALEHAAATMFGDLSDESVPPVRVTLGAMPEARFWAVRLRVRRAAIEQGMPVVPGIGLIFKALKVPWYHRLPGEPMFEALGDAPLAAAALDAAANPQAGGNAGLTREARATRRLVDHAELPRLVEHMTDAAAVARFLRSGDFGIGPRLLDAIERWL